MKKLTEYTSYADAQRHFATSRLWELLDGTAEAMNIAHECIDRHAGRNQVAINVFHADGSTEVLGFEAVSAASSQFAHYLVAQGVTRGSRVAIMLEPSLAYYAALFGAMKMGAIAVPLFTLFGPDGIRLRLEDSTPSYLITNADKRAVVGEFPGLSVVVADDAFMVELARYPSIFAIATRGDDLAVLQYTSGTTRALPEAVRHTHRSILTVLVAALYGTGLRPGDRFFCPSSPAWGHGMWHGTLAPLALGITTGTYSGKFDPVRLCEALEQLQITNLSAAATHYRMIRNAGVARDYRYSIEKLSFTGEPLDSETAEYTAALFGTPACSMYGTTEIGVILVNYPGAADFQVKPGSLGKPIPGALIAVQNARGEACAPGETGELKIRRHQKWLPTKDRSKTDEDGYFYHCGRADDVIISAGWTISAVEVEDAILKHPDVKETAVIGAPDPLRGLVVKAFVVTNRPGDDAFVNEIQNLVRFRLAQHEYPRLIEFVADLPKTPAGKVNRKILRDLETA